MYIVNGFALKLSDCYYGFLSDCRQISCVEGHAAGIKLDYGVYSTMVHSISQWTMTRSLKDGSQLVQLK
jgi:hypothetical protein